MATNTFVNVSTVRAFSPLDARDSTQRVLAMGRGYLNGDAVVEGWVRETDSTGVPRRRRMVLFIGPAMRPLAFVDSNVNNAGRYRFAHLLQLGPDEYYAVAAQSPDLSTVSYLHDAITASPQ